MKLFSQKLNLSATFGLVVTTMFLLVGYYKYTSHNVVAINLCKMCQFISPLVYRVADNNNA